MLRTIIIMAMCLNAQQINSEMRTTKKVGFVSLSVGALGLIAGKVANAYHSKKQNATSTVSSTDAYQPNKMAKISEILYKNKWVFRFFIALIIIGVILLVVAYFKSKKSAQVLANEVVADAQDVKEAVLA